MTTDRDLKLDRLFTTAMMVTVALSGVILSLAEGAFFPSGITPIVAVLAWLVVDRYRLMHVSPVVANILGAIAFAVAANEFRSNNIEAKLLSGAHLIVYLTWVVLGTEKTVRQYWWILALSVLQIAVASVLTSSPAFGASLVVVMGVMIWTLAVFSLYRAYSRFKSGSESTVTRTQRAANRRGMNRITVRNGLQLDPAEPWVNRQLRGVVFVSFLGSLVMSLFVFALFPRIWVPGSPFADMARDGERRLKGRTGFTETVTLGDIGEVLQSDNRALQFEITDLRSKSTISAEQFISDMDMDEIRFRGNALGQYLNARWSHGIPEKLQDTYGRFVNYRPRYEITIIQDPPIGEFVFAVNPLTEASSDRKNDRILRWQLSGVLSWESFHSRRRADPRSQRTYTIQCPSIREFPDATIENWRIPADESPENVQVRLERFQHYAERFFLSDELDQQLPRLHRIATELCTDEGEPVDELVRVQRVMDYLTPQNGFEYSLTIPYNNEGLDPIEDFILNTRSGSCEYYASAGALMLQAVGIPARIVNGYVGSELNPVSGRYEVRQKHAHSWVEAFYDGRWRTLDPTPSSSRRELVAASRSMMLFRQLKLAMSDVWSSGIQNLSWEQQVALVAPFFKVLKDAWDDIQRRGLWTSLTEFVTELFTSPDKWFSWQGGVATFLFLLLIAGIWKLRLFSRLWNLMRGIRHSLGVRERTTRSVIRFYERFCSLCESHGLAMQESATAIENAAAATNFFTDKLRTPDLRSAPGVIALAFNDVRFGQLVLSPTRAESVRKALAEFHAALAQSATAGMPSETDVPDGTVSDEGLSTSDS